MDTSVGASVDTSAVVSVTVSVVLARGVKAQGKVAGTLCQVSPLSCEDESLFDNG